jgi:hypothetical protein
MEIQLYNDAKIFMVDCFRHGCQILTMPKKGENRCFTHSCQILTMPKKGEKLCFRHGCQILTMPKKEQKIDVLEMVARS